MADDLGAESAIGLRVLITNIGLGSFSGTTLYVRDLALELRRQGHVPAVFSSTDGPIPQELADSGVPVGQSLRRLGGPPDIIHGHHFTPTMMALRRWPGAPAVHLCHDHVSFADRTPVSPFIYRHAGVSRVCVERLMRDGAPADRVRLLLNFVDMKRFLPRAPLPARPRRALVFSNYARADTYLPVVSDACRRARLELDVVGSGSGNVAERPELLLGQYDIVFAKAKAAMEAMAVGAAVVLCDFSGVGPMVTAAQFDGLRPLNFGYEALRGPLQSEVLLAEIARYDPQDAAMVRDRIRASAGLEHAVADLVKIYDEVIAEHRSTGPAITWVPPPLVRERLGLRLSWAWQRLPQSRRASLRRLPGVGEIMTGAKRLLMHGG